MKYYGQELTEFASKKPIAFDPPKQMLVWDEVKWHEPTTDYMGL